MTFLSCLRQRLSEQLQQLYVAYYKMPAYVTLRCSFNVKRHSVSKTGKSWWTQNHLLQLTDIHSKQLVKWSTTTLLKIYKNTPLQQLFMTNMTLMQHCNYVSPAYLHQWLNLLSCLHRIQSVAICSISSCWLDFFFGCTFVLSESSSVSTYSNHPTHKNTALTINLLPVAVTNLNSTHHWKSEVIPRLV